MSEFWFFYVIILMLVLTAAYFWKYRDTRLKPWNDKTARVSLICLALAILFLVVAIFVFQKQ